MAEPEPGAKVARDLGIYLGQLYGWVKRGLVKNYKEDGYPNGKGLLVDPNEAKVAWMGSKKKGPRAPRAPREPKTTTRGATTEAPQAKKFKPGAIVSYEKGRGAGASEAGRPHYNVGQVLGSSGRLTFLDDGGRRVHYNGTQIDNVVFATERLSYWMARGVARIEHPVPVLGMVLLSFILDDKLELAKSLEEWMESEGLDVQIPEIMDLPTEDEDEDYAQPATAEEGEEDE
jgi:hypothetical protein